MKEERDWVYYSELYEHLAKQGYNDAVATAIMEQLGEEARFREWMSTRVEASGGRWRQHGELADDEDSDTDDADESESGKGRAHPADVKQRAQELMDEMLEFVELVNRS